jgi:hypothetical protein
MNTQEIQEWSEEFDERWYLWNLDGLAYTTCGEEVKSFISQKLKEQEERHKREIEELTIEYQTILSKYEK